ncbi:carboxypeptidase-like regulatory domain-containing protein [Ekhidna sp.]|uniref:carboxypeptidase-like regulatory domain-containing protein n=1 Tax=Ekhidna sp. TaxID=2608089 RepID=UPI003296DE5A
MKNSIFYLITTLLVIVLCTGCEEPTFESQGILTIMVIDITDGEGTPVSNATIKAYSDIEGWDFETNMKGQYMTDTEGEIVITDLTAGIYYLDIAKDNRNNWQYPLVIEVEDGDINGAYSTIEENLNAYISSASGISWEIVGISDSVGNDLSGNPSYSCAMGNVATFEKTGTYTLQDTGITCDEASLVEGSWWGVGINSLMLLLDEGTTVVSHSVFSLQSNSFSATFFKNDEYITYHYEKR